MLRQRDQTTYARAQSPAPGLAPGLLGRLQEVAHLHLDGLAPPRDLGHEVIEREIGYTPGEITDLAKEGVFRYGGRTSEAKQVFLDRILACSPGRGL